MSGGDQQGSDRQVQAPILIVGSPRSGTTLLGHLLSRHPDIAYWEEPRPIWSQGHAWRRDDSLDATDLTPSIARRIDARFSQFLMKSGRARFCEKTPSNCLRLRFIEALYPDARLIHLVRDGRAVVTSMIRMLSKAPDADRVKARLSETPWRDLPALAPVFLRDTVERRLAGRKPFWGPRPPGWREWLDLPVPLMLARQWRTLVETALRDLTAFPSEHQGQIRYEDFVAAPREGLTRLLDLAGLRADPDFLETAAAEVRPSSFADEWRQTLSDETIAQIETEAGPLLEQLGYSLTRSTPARPS